MPALADLRASLTHVCALAPVLGRRLGLGLRPRRILGSWSSSFPVRDEEGGDLQWGHIHWVPTVG